MFLTKIHIIKDTVIFLDKLERFAKRDHQSWASAEGDTRYYIDFYSVAGGCFSASFADKEKRDAEYELIKKEVEELCAMGSEIVKSLKMISNCKGEK